MKWPCLSRLSLATLCIATLCLAGCESFNQPLGGDYDPLSAPGSRTKLDRANVNPEIFQPGQYITVAKNSTAFFSKRPTGDAEAELLLSAGTSMRVIKTEGAFLRVELDRDGKVGYVNGAMVTDGRASQPSPSGAVQVYPPIGGGYDNPMPPAAGAASPAVLSDDTPLPPISPPSVPEIATPSPTGKPESTAAVTPKPATPAAQAEKAKESVELPEPADTKAKNP